MRLIPVLLSIFLFSCAAHREKICKTCTLQQVTTVDTVEVSKIDTLIFTTENPCKELCDSVGNLKPFSRDIKSDKGKVVVLYSKSNKLHVKEENEAKEIIITKTVNKEVPARCQLEHLTKWDSFFIISGKVAYALILLLLAYKGAKMAL